MSGLHKFSFKSLCLFSAAAIFCTVLTLQAIANQKKRREIYGSLTADANENINQHRQDTIPSPPNKPTEKIIAKKSNDTVPSRSQADTSFFKENTDSIPTVARIDTFDVKFSKDTLDAPVTYEAEDSAVLLVKENKFILYGKTKTEYKDVVVTAPTTIVDNEKNMLTALGSKDSAGNIITRATFKQGSSNFQSESFNYNFKSQKGITKNTYTQEGEMYVKATVSKKIDQNTVYVKEGYFTTCDLDDPHFAFKANKIKIISNKLAISGPTHPEFEGVPIPIYLPFGLFPLSQGRHSGLLAPQFTNNQQYGLGLEGLGYYHVLNDYVDVAVRSNIYSYGGWNLYITPSYRKRYRYSGTFNLSIQHNKIAFKGDPDYSLSKTFQINWSHTTNSRGTGTTFNATVNAGSTRYNRYIANDPYRSLNNNLYSSIAYSKQWQGKPYSLQLSANHNQNSVSNLINIILPDAGFSVATQYPFQRKEMVGTPRWYEKIGIGYNGVARNQVSFYDTGHASFSKILDTLQWGAQHRFPISLQLPPLGNFFISPAISFDETWYARRFSRKWDSAKGKVDTVSLQKGFYRDQQMSFSLGFNTNIYGMFMFGKNSKIRAIRHVIRPSIGFTYKPNLSKRNYDYVQVNAAGTKLPLAQFDGNLFPAYSYGRFGGLTFLLDNNFEMKVHGKKDSVDRKVKLIDGLSFSSAYNFLDTAFKLQPVNISLRTTLFEKISISANALLDPYQVSTTTGLRINRFVWQGSRFTLGRFTSGSVSASTSFQSKQKDGKKPSLQPGQTNITDPRLLADQQLLADYMRQNPAEFADFNIDWSVSLSYSLSVTRRLKADFSGDTSSVYSSVSFNNSFNLTPKWKFSTQGFYDFNTKKITMFTMSIAREMHCWQMSIGVTPIGLTKYYNITISPKSGMLRDLRVNRTRSYYNF